MNEATTENTAWITSISGAWLKWRADMLISTLAGTDALYGNILRRLAN